MDKLEFTTGYMKYLQDEIARAEKVISTCKIQLESLEDFQAKLKKEMVKGKEKTDVLVQKA